MIKIIQVESTKDYVPLGISVFKKTTEFYLKEKVDLIVADNEDKVLFFIEQIKKDDIILFPIYLDPLPVINIIINKIKEKINDIRVFICGPLAENNPEKCLEIINADDVMYNQYPFKFYKNKYDFVVKEKHILPAEYKFSVYDKNLYFIIPNAYNCGKKYSFCKKNYPTEILFSITDLLNLIPSFPEDIVSVEIEADDIFNIYSFKDVNFLLEEIHKKTKCKQIYLWTHVENFIKNIKNINKININEDFYIIIRIGLESYSESQLKRFNKNILSHNFKFIKIMEKNFLNKKIKIEPLFFIFEPWVSPEEIYESYNYYSKIKEYNLECTSVGNILTSLILRYWLPIPETKMFNKALNENLLKKNHLNPFGFTEKKENLLSSKDISWNFSNPNSEFIFNKLCTLRQFYLENIAKIKTKDKKGCIVCNGGKSYFYKEWREVDSLILNWILNYKNNDLFDAILTKIIAIKDIIINKYPSD